jgi:hypothetical protein
MKNACTIHMGASRWDVTVRGSDGTPVCFDLYRMPPEARKRFQREFMRTYRKAYAA